MISLSITMRSATTPPPSTSLVKPVTLPPGRAILVASPTWTGRHPEENDRDGLRRVAGGALVAFRRS